MVMQATEPTNSGKLEQVLASTQKENVSETPDNDTPETSDQATEPTNEVPEGKEAPEETPAIKWTPEQQVEINKLVQSEADKRSNRYRQNKEADANIIRELRLKNADLLKASRAKEADNYAKLILGNDVNDGFTEEQTAAREKAIKEIIRRDTEYHEKSSEVESTVEYIDAMVKQMPANIISKFELDDPNPNIRAVHGMELVNEAVTAIKQNDNFLMALEYIAPKGTEVRRQLEDAVKEMQDFQDEKAKRLFLESKTRGMKTAPRKAPNAPSGDMGGNPTFYESQLADRDFWEANRVAILKAQAAGRIKPG